MYGLSFQGEIGEAGKKMTLRGSGDCEWRGSTPGPVALKGTAVILDGSIPRPRSRRSFQRGEHVLGYLPRSPYRGII